MPDARNPLPRSTSNPSYSMRAQFDAVPEVIETVFVHINAFLPTLQEDDAQDPRTIWTPHPRGMVAGLNDYLDPSDDGMVKGQGRHPQQHMPHHRTPPLPQPNYYNEDFDNVAYSTANTLLKEDNMANIGRSIWNDRGMLRF